MRAVDTDLEREVAELEAHLRSRGVHLNSLQDWISGRTPLAAEEVLAEWLGRTKSDEIRDLIARVLTQKEFKRSIPALLQAFRASVHDDTRWSIANAISRIGFRRVHWPEILSLAGDNRFGRGRQLLVFVLHRIRLPETEGVLLLLLNDPDVDAFALRALSFCGTYATYEHLRTLSVDGRSVLFKRMLETGIPRLAAKLGKRPN